MPRYLVVRKFQVEREEDLSDLGRRLGARMAKETRLEWEHTHVTLDDEGTVRTFCVYGAPNEETVLRYTSALDQALGEHQIESVMEIAGDVTPADFPGDS